jgi:hypothetical protein
MKKNMRKALQAIAAITAVQAAGQKNVQPFGFDTVGAYTCQAMQASLVDYYGQNVGMYRTGAQFALIKWLLSPQNTANFTRIDMTSVPGKKRPVVFRLQDPYCFELCQTNLECNQTPVYVDHTTKEVVFDLVGEPFRHCDGTGKPVVLRYSEADLMKYCKDTDQSIIQADMSRYLLQFEAALDKAFTGLFITQVGTNDKGQAITNIPFWVKNTTTNTENINPNAVFYLNQQFQNLGVQAAQYAMLGGATVNKLAVFNKWQAANDAGVDMSQTNDLNPYMFYDRNFEGNLGVDDVIMATPGVVQLVTWNKYKGEKERKVTNLYTHGTVALPTTGLEVDFKWTYDHKCEVWTYECFLYAELATVPAGGCGTLQGVNGLIRIHDCSLIPLLNDCPTP